MSLTVQTALPPTAPDVIAEMTEFQTALMEKGDETELFTEHLLHGGMYARTITLPPFTRIVGALMKVPTVVITVGTGLVSVGREMKAVAGYRVIPGCAGRKQVFVTADAPLVITMLFPTSAKTVEEAEAEFTDEAGLLLSRRQDLNSVEITGE